MKRKTSQRPAKRRRWRKTSSQERPGSTQRTLFDALDLPQRTLAGEQGNGQSGLLQSLAADAAKSRTMAIVLALLIWSPLEATMKRLCEFHPPCNCQSPLPASMPDQKRE